MTDCNNIINMSDVRFKTIRQYYKNKRYLTLFVEIVTGTHEQKKLSLRMFDWVTTNYSKKYDVMYKLPEMDSLFDLHNDYRNQLKAYTKKNFDPFCRDDKILFNYKKNGESQCVETSFAQLNFFKWAISKKVVNYILEHFDRIYKDMNEANKKQRKESEKHKKRLLSDSSTKKRTSETLRSSTEYSYESELTKPISKINIIEFTSPKKKSSTHRKTTRKPRQELSESSAKRINKCKANVIINFI